MKKRRGFTLIELVMVVAILGVLSSVALVKYTDVSKDSKENSDYIAANNIATAAKLAINDGADVDGIDGVDDLVDLGYLEGTPIVQSVQGQNSFEIVIDKGTVTVKVGNEVFYPKFKKETTPDK